MSKLKEVRWDQASMINFYFSKEQCLEFVRSFDLDVRVDFDGNPVLERLDEDDPESGVQPVQHIVFNKKYWDKWQVQWWVREQLAKSNRSVIRVRLHGEDEKGHMFLSQIMSEFAASKGIRVLNPRVESMRATDAEGLDESAKALQDAIVCFEHRDGPSNVVVADEVLKEARGALRYFNAPDYVIKQLDAAIEGQALPRPTIFPIDTVGVPEEDMVYVSIGRKKDEDVVVYKGRNISICPTATKLPVNPHMGIPVVYCDKHGMLGIDQETSFLGEHYAYTHLINENGNPYTGYQTRMSVGFFTTLEYLKQAFYFFVKDEVSRRPFGDDIEAAWAAQGVVDELKELGKK